MADAYDEKGKNYKTIMGVAGASAAVAGVELAIAGSSESFGFIPPCNSGFATANLAISGVMLGFATTLNGRQRAQQKITELKLVRCKTYSTNLISTTQRVALTKDQCKFLLLLV